MSKPRALPLAKEPRYQQDTDKMGRSAQRWKEKYNKYSIYAGVTFCENLAYIEIAYIESINI
jgi:hypothetical protein